MPIPGVQRRIRKCAHGKQKARQPDGSNADCEHGRQTAKGKELQKVLQKAGLNFEYQKHVPLRTWWLATETTHPYIEFVIQKAWGVVFLQCDEEQHKAYDPRYDLRWDFVSSGSVLPDKSVVLRYNPDAFQIGGVTRKITKKERQEKLIEVLRSWDEDPVPGLKWFRFFLFYDAADDSATLPLVAESWEEDIRAISRRLA